jgi:DNA-3-methyladenine glycosylase I
VSELDGVLAGEDGIARCWWCAATPEYRAYHDAEWGFPVADERRLFEKLSLEGFQSGLSWLTILRKREAFRRAFAGFDPERVARFGERDVARLLGDAGIIRHRGKIEATIAGARATLAVRDSPSGSLERLVWSFEPGSADRELGPSRSELAARTTTPESVALAKELKRRGFRFVGPTTAYAFMQSMGLVDDHLAGCATRPAVERARLSFARPA